MSDNISRKMNGEKTAKQTNKQNHVMNKVYQIKGIYFALENLKLKKVVISHLQ
jgi:hypothetical protein